MLTCPIREVKNLPKYLTSYDYCNLLLERQQLFPATKMSATKKNIFSFTAKCFGEFWCVQLQVPLNHTNVQNYNSVCVQICLSIII
mgnify:CR=1 FL=1